MKKFLLGLLILTILVGIGGYAYYRFFMFEPPLISDEDRQHLTIMPLPAKLELTGDTFEFDENFGVIIEGEYGAKLEKAVERFGARISAMHGITVHEQGSGLTIINQMKGKPVPTGNEDESYKLMITNSGIELQSTSEYGALHGLETILQLIDGNQIPALELEDNPRFAWRGLMIDVSRHWIPKDVILRNLDAMAAMKMNVLHLHLSDDQGFRMESKTHPKLHEVGSNGRYFTQEEMSEIIQYAADRGIRILPEFDVPGHTKSWLIAYPQYASIQKEFEFGRSRDDELFTVPMDPTNESTYEFLDAFFAEMAGLFPDPYMHIGGDEVNPKYWEENPRIREFMDENDLENAHELQLHFNKRMNRILERHGKKMMGWEEILAPDLPDNVIVQSWINQRSLIEAVQSGYYGVLSAGLYLDHKLHAGEHYSVDPLVLPGAVEVEPDTSHWRMYDLTMDVPGNQMDTKLVLFDRNPDDLNGFFAMFDQRSGFTGGTLEENQLSFTFEAGNIGELSFDAELIGDSLVGAISLGPLSFDANGRLSGGHEIPGSEMPEIEVIEPLTPEQEARIIGAEAAMWTEVVSAETIDSRIWPRTAAIAEKLWSPRELTGDTDDMYRRLQITSDYLDSMGLTHQSYREPMLREIAGEAYEPLKELVSVLEESKYYNRHQLLTQFEEIYLPDLELKYIADAAPPESMEAREFNQLAESYFEENSGEKEKQIISYLENWAGLHDQLSSYFAENEKLRDVRELSNNFSKISELSLIKLRGGEVVTSEEEINELLTSLEVGENGVVVAVVPGLRQILMAS